MDQFSSIIIAIIALFPFLWLLQHAYKKYSHPKPWIIGGAFGLLIAAILLEADQFDCYYFVCPWMGQVIPMLYLRDALHLGVDVQMGSKIETLYVIISNGIIYSLSFGLIAQRKPKPMLMGIFLIVWPFIYVFSIYLFSWGS